MNEHHRNSASYRLYQSPFSYKFSFTKGAHSYNQFGALPDIPMALKENVMKDPDRVAHRLALLEGVSLSKADLEFIANEIGDLERVMAELEEFGQETPWISQQAQPPGKKA